MSTYSSPPLWVVDRIDEYLMYDETIRGVIWTKSPSSRAKVGVKAGTINRQGYSYIRFTHQVYEVATVAAHWIVWYLHTGGWPATEIDHIDGDRQNNLFENLRLATDAQNNLNRGPHINNQLGHKNISYCPLNPLTHMKKKRNPFVVRVYRAGVKVLYKRCKTLEEAIAARDAWYEKYGCEFSRV